jgi:hypothetical protein
MLVSPLVMVEAEMEREAEDLERERELAAVDLDMERGLTTRREGRPLCGRVMTNGMGLLPLPRNYLTQNPSSGEVVERR